MLEKRAREHFRKRRFKVGEILKFAQARKVEANDPIRLIRPKLFNGKTLKVAQSVGEQGFEGRHQQRFAEPPRAGEENLRAFSGQRMG